MGESVWAHQRCWSRGTVTKGAVVSAIASLECLKSPLFPQPDRSSLCPEPSLSQKAGWICASVILVCLLELPFLYPALWLLLPCFEAKQDKAPPSLLHETGS